MIGDRALGSAASGGAYFGSPASAAVAGYTALGLTNTTTGALTMATIGFDGEQWRNGGNTATQSLVLSYGFGTTFAGVTIWTTPGATFNFTSPTVGATAAALDGNASANRVAGLGGTLSLNWAINDTLWIRWADSNDAGNDHGLAIDNFSFAAVPEPSTYIGGTILVGLAAFSQRKRLGSLLTA